MAFRNIAYYYRKQYAHSLTLTTPATLIAAAFVGHSAFSVATVTGDIQVTRSLIVPHRTLAAMGRWSL